jgi:FkbM family methyltransferase
MAFETDPYWLDAKHFLKTHRKSGEKMIAPARYRRELPDADGYAVTRDRTVEQVEWVLVHKGMSSQIDRTFLQQALAILHPVFANEVFVILSRQQGIGSATEQMKPHLQALLQKVDSGKATHPQPTASNWIRRSLTAVKRAMETPDPIERLSDQLDSLQTQVHQLNRKLQKLQQNQQLVLTYRPDRLGGLSMQELRQVCRSACQTAYLGNDTILCRVLTSYLLYGDAQDVGIVPHLSLNGFWEGWVTLAMARLLQPGWYCLDVGANAGYYSLLMAGAVGASGRVLAVEPNPKLVDLLNKTLEVNGFQSWATVLPQAVSNTTGTTVQLAVPQGHPGNGTITGAQANDTVYTTETITIDQITEHWPRVDLIKIDAEGAEEQIWQGMRQTIRRHPNVQIVLEFGAVRYADPQAFLAEIQAEGFVLRCIESNGVLQDLTPERCLTERLDRHWDLFLSRPVS